MRFKKKGLLQPFTIACAMISLAFLQGCNSKPTKPAPVVCLKVKKGGTPGIISKNSVPLVRPPHSSLPSSLSHSSQFVSTNTRNTSIPNPTTHHTPLNVNRTHSVTQGETLFSIASKNKVDPQKLALLNRVHPPYLVKVGQQLILPGTPTPFPDSATPSANVATTTRFNSNFNSTNDSNNPINPIHSNNSKPLHSLTSAQKQSTQQSTQIKTTTAKTSIHSKFHQQTMTTHKIRWRWPIKGKIIRNFYGQGKGRGLDIGGKPGLPIKAAAPGVVVYSGNGLKGYGNLIIIKHSEDFLSAYAHNRELRVKEGERVVLGQEIATMGQTDSEQVKVHFEIRYRGKPVDPMKFLPKA